MYLFSIKRLWVNLLSAAIVTSRLVATPSDPRVSNVLQQSELVQLFNLNREVVFVYVQETLLCFERRFG